MGHVGALCPDRPGFCPVFGIDQWFQWALHNRDIVSQNESLNPISGTDFRVKKSSRMAPVVAIFSGLALARISHRVKRIGAPNQRKLFCENDFLMIRGEPRCRQSVSRIFLDLKPSKAAR